MRRFVILVLLFTLAPNVIAKDSFLRWLNKLKHRYPQHKEIIDINFDTKEYHNRYERADALDISHNLVEKFIRFENYWAVSRFIDDSVRYICPNAPNYALSATNELEENEVADRIDYILKHTSDVELETICSKPSELKRLVNWGFGPDPFTMDSQTPKRTPLKKKAIKDESVTPEFVIKKTFEQVNADKFDAYFTKFVTQSKIDRVLKYMSDPEKVKALLKVERDSGVEKEAILALMVVESKLGNEQGIHNVMHVLATRSWLGIRSDFNRRQLVSSFKICEAGYIPKVKKDDHDLDCKNMKGSFAGAMGQVQFMPFTFLHYAVDGDGDGKIDIWNNYADAFASAANYLKQHHWEFGAPWRIDITLTQRVAGGAEFYETGLSKQKNFLRNEDDQYIFDDKGKKKIKDYSPYKVPVEKLIRRGVPVPDDLRHDVLLYLPHGNQPGMKGYLLHDNFGSLMRWNNSSYFAFSVLSIMDELKAIPLLELPSSEEEEFLDLDDPNLDL